MNITKIKVSLTGEDLLSIYSEFVSVEGLEVKDIKINDEISKIVLKNNKVSVEILNLGAIVEKINVEDRYGNNSVLSSVSETESFYISSTRRNKKIK